MTPWERLWQPVMESCHLMDGTPKKARLMGKDVCVWRTNEGVAAVNDVCPHMHTSLSLGKIVEMNGDKCIRCGNHGYAFDESGECLNIPQIPDKNRAIPKWAMTNGYRAKEERGLIWIALRQPVFHLIPIPELDDTNYWAGPMRGHDPYHKLPTYRAWPSTIPRANAQAADMSHFAFAHPMLGRPDLPEVPEFKCTEHNGMLRVQYNVDQPATDLGWPNTSYDMTITPNEIVLRKSEPGGKILVIWQALAQVEIENGKESFIRFCRMIRNYDKNETYDLIHEGGQDEIEMEDYPLVISQYPRMMPVLGEGMTLTKPGDVPVIAYVKFLQNHRFVSAKGEVIL